MALTKVEAEQLQAAQTSITSVGTLTGLTTSGLVTIDGSGAFLQVDVGGTMAARVGSSNDIVGGTDNDAIFQTRTGADMRFYSGSSESMRIDSNGKVGIGLSTSLSSTLNINTEISVGPDANNRGIINYSSDTLSFGTRQSSTNYFSTVNISDGKVGIGTADPSVKLHLRGSAVSGATFNPDDALTIEQAGGGGSNVNLISSSNTGILFSDAAARAVGLINYLHTDNSMRFNTDGSERMHIDTNGNVGIGVTPSTLWSSSYEALQIGLGASIAAHNAAGNAMKIGSNMVYEGTAPNYYDKYLTSATAAKYELDVHGHKWYYAASGTAGNAISWKEAMRINSSGNVGIGSTSPSFSTINSVTSQITGLEIFKDGTDTAAALKLAGDNGSGTKAHAQVGYSGANGTAHFANFNTGGTQVGEIVIGPTGNVGIGEPAPDRTFHAKSGANSNDGVIRIESANNNIMDIGTDGTGHFINCVNTDPFRVKFAGTEKFRIESSGDVDLINGGNLKFAAGYGVSFINNTDTAAGETVTSSVLDEYEEGRWSPDLRNGTTSLTTQTFNYGPRAIYTKIGRVVYIHFSGRLSAVAGTGGAEFRLFGLPFTAANFGGYQEMRLKVIIGNNVTATYAQYGLFAFARSNANDFGFRVMTGADTLFTSDQLQANTFLSVTGFYFTSM